MKFSRLTKDGDWTFGQGLANYATDSEALNINVVTRLKSFANDWFLDLDANIDWLTILGTPKNEEIILNEVERVVTETENVIRVNNMELLKNIEKRSTSLIINIDTLFDRQILINIEI